jgi:hypothetical protein
VRVTKRTKLDGTETWIDEDGAMYESLDELAKINMVDPAYIEVQFEMEEEPGPLIPPKTTPNASTTPSHASSTHGWIATLLLATSLLTGLLWVVYGRIFPELLPPSVTESVEGVAVLFLFAFFLMVAAVSLVYAATSLRKGGTHT